MTSTPGAPGAGTLSRGGETASYTGIEIVTIAPACLTGAPEAPPPGGIVLSSDSGSVGLVTVDGVAPAAAASPVELGAVIALVDRRRRLLRLDGRASFLIRAAVPVDPHTWSWRIRRARRTLVRSTPEVTLRGAGLARSRVRSRIAVGDGNGQVWFTRADLPARVRRAVVVDLPATTLASPTLRAAVIDHALAPLRGRHRKALPRILLATNRALTLAGRDGPVTMRVVVTAPRSLRWIRRLERLPAARLRRAIGGKRIVLSRGATLRVVSVRSSSRATLVLRRR